MDLSSNDADAPPNTPHTQWPTDNVQQQRQRQAAQRQMRLDARQQQQQRIDDQRKQQQLAPQQRQQQQLLQQQQRQQHQRRQEHERRNALLQHQVESQKAIEQEHKQRQLDMMHNKLKQKDDVLKLRLREQYMNRQMQRNSEAPPETSLGDTRSTASSASAQYGMQLPSGQYTVGVNV